MNAGLLNMTLMSSMNLVAFIQKFSTSSIEISQIDGSETYQRSLRMFSFLLIISNAFKTLFQEQAQMISNILFISQLCLVILRLSQDIERLGAEAGKRKMKNACSNISKITKSIIAINIISQYFAFFSNITMISSVLVLSISSFIMQSYLQRLRVPKVVADTEFVSQFLNGFVFFGLIYFAFSASFLLERNQLIFDEVSIGISIYIMNKAPRVGAGVWKLFVERSNVERS